MASSSTATARPASGRTSGNAVRRYLEALENNRPKRGRKRTPESINARLAKKPHDKRLLTLKGAAERLLANAKFYDEARTFGLDALFREVGIYEKHGQLDGVWRDVVIVERLIPENQPDRAAPGRAGVEGG